MDIWIEVLDTEFIADFAQIPLLSDLHPRLFGLVELDFNPTMLSKFFLECQLFERIGSSLLGLELDDRDTSRFDLALLYPSLESDHFDIPILLADLVKLIFG